MAPRDPQPLGFKLTYPLVLLSLIPIFLIVYLLANYALNIPYHDEWIDTNTVDIAIITSSGRIPSFELLATEWSQHRVFFTRVITMLSTFLTGWDVRFDKWVGFVAALLGLMLLYATQRTLNQTVALWLMVPTALLVFSPRQYVNWLLAYQNCMFFVCLWVFAAGYLLVRGPIGWRTLLMLMLCAMYATLSLGLGLGLWIAMLPTLWLRGYRNWRHYAAWCGVSAFVIFLYIVHDPAVVVRFVIEISLLDRMVYAVTFLASPLVFGAPQAILAAQALALGAIIVTALNLRYLLTRAPLPQLAVPMLLILMGVGNTALAAFGRAGWAHGDPLHSRYVTTASLFWYGVLMLGGLAAWYAYPARKKRPHRLMWRVQWIALSVGIGAYMFGNVVEWRGPITTANTVGWNQPLGEACTLQYLQPMMPACQATIPTYLQDRFYQKAPLLAENRLTIYGVWEKDIPPTEDIHAAHVQYLYGNREQQPTLDPATKTVRQPLNSRIEQHIKLSPQASTLTATLQAQQTNTYFRFFIRQGRAVTPLLNTVYTDSPSVAEMDLSAWRGQNVVLVYEVDGANSSERGWAEWQSLQMTEGASP